MTYCRRTCVNARRCECLCVCLDNTPCLVLDCLMEYPRGFRETSHPERRSMDISASRKGSASHREHKSRSKAGSSRRDHREHREHDMFFVPDPPAWSAWDESQSEQWDDTMYYLPSPETSSDLSCRGRYGAEKSQSSRHPKLLDAVLEYEPDSGLFSPPPTPRIPRLKTPDIDHWHEFSCSCNSCRRAKRHAEQKSKMEIQRMPPASPKTVVEPVHFIGQKLKKMTKHADSSSPSGS